MKFQINMLCFLLTMTVCAPLSYGAGDLPDNIYLPPEGETFSEEGGLSDAEINKIVENALKEQLKAGNSGGTTASSGSNEISGNEINKTFRYQTKKGLFNGAELPKRTFNNITYPY